MRLRLGLLCVALMQAQVALARRATEAAKRASVALAPLLHAHKVELGVPVFIRILKSEATLEVFVKAGARYELLQSYPICAFSGVLGPKRMEGDAQAPEGIYHVRANQLNPNSSFHLSFNLGYPNVFDQAHKRTGSALMVHGNCVSIGCYAMTDSKIEEIYTLVAAALGAGQSSVPVHIFPFALSKPNLAQYHGSEWHSFWRELQPIYLAFEKDKVPPKVKVSGLHYRLER
jgi:murein L,D-transpeptidase YafK